MPHNPLPGGGLGRWGWGGVSGLRVISLQGCEKTLPHKALVFFSSHLNSEITIVLAEVRLVISFIIKYFISPS